MFQSCQLYVGAHVRLSEIAHQLARLGYARQRQVERPGEFSVRGHVLDVFPGTYEAPIRAILDGQRIEAIRSFNPVTGELLESHTVIILLPRAVRLTVREEVPLDPFVDIQPGDVVVHLNHGIGRYVGVERMTHRGQPTDCLILEYAGGDRLYVPTDHMHLVQKYLGLAGRAPTLHTLGGQAWARAKERARAGAFQYARELLETQARRVALRGFAFSADGEWQRPFETEFPYRETPDQRTSTDAVKRDMEAPRPMDRLLLGDVGYGKTEVALRAAFKAVMDHKQVAVLVPTTILAEQHFRTFTQRLAAYPIVVEMLSRFRTPHEQTALLRRLRDGYVDILIGTHRLLSPDVQFQELGLLIVDEEQRFGVKAKEHLKHLRWLVDVLVLTASPIPRTLYLALVGAKDMSLLTTPPEHRHPIETSVGEYDATALQRWIRRELQRRGQVYFVHNRIADIVQVGRTVQALVPEARVGIVHGQMSSLELEEVMGAFIEGQVDVLVTTTIVESGIDIPNANTLIVDRADQVGLADLYQLRGRVGRFDRKAYAYLLVPPGTVLTREARERLRAIMEHTQLGAGFHLAMEDLKIRGAGNLLGVEQHGHVSAVGFDLYCRLLRTAIAHLTHEARG